MENCSACAIAVVPVVTTGLHCGIDYGIADDVDPEESSPSSRRGSIAARTRRDARPSHRCRPRRHDGAPLRRSDERREQRPVCGSSPSSRRGSIAARVPRETRSNAPAGRPRRHDGAPLRPSVPTQAHRPALRRPRRHDGAPLRRRVRRAAPPLLRVVPVVTTGLHCGSSCSAARPAQIELSSPSSRRGSIAARTRHRRTCTDGPVVPVVTTGLHCGTDARGRRWSLDTSSPSSRRGSIAARGSRPASRGPTGSSPSSRRGSIAAMH